MAASASERVRKGLPQKGRLNQNRLQTRFCTFHPEATMEGATGGQRALYGSGRAPMPPMGFFCCQLPCLGALLPLCWTPGKGISLSESPQTWVPWGQRHKRCPPAARVRGAHPQCPNPCLHRPAAVQGASSAPTTNTSLLPCCLTRHVLCPCPCRARFLQTDPMQRCPFPSPPSVGLHSAPPLYRDLLN